MAELDDLIAVAHEVSQTDADAATTALYALPWLTQSIEDDRTAGRFTRWGRSTVIDENVGSAVLSRAAFEALHTLAGLPSAWPVGNAGLLHCYGYLLSLTPTPYGMKRDRWLDGQFARTLTLAADHFIPWTGDETLLARADAAASGILSTAEWAWLSAIDGRMTQVGLGEERKCVRPLAYAVAPQSGMQPLLVTLFPIAGDDRTRRLIEGQTRLRWNAV